MAATHLIRRLLRTSALAAAGLLLDSVTSEFEPRSRSLETDSLDQDVGAHGSRLAVTRALDRVPDWPIPELGRLEALIDDWGETEPAFAAMLVGTALCAAKPLERTAIVCDWATSQSAIHRRALARALAHPFMCAGIPTAIEVLAQDADEHVRTAAAQAALLRLGHDPERYGDVLDRIEQVERRAMARG
jgi:hypothetical protein